MGEDFPILTVQCGFGHARAKIDSIESRPSDQKPCHPMHVPCMFVCFCEAPASERFGIYSCSVLGVCINISWDASPCSLYGWPDPEAHNFWFAQGYLTIYDVRTCWVHGGWLGMEASEKTLLYIYIDPPIQLVYSSIATKSLKFESWQLFRGKQVEDPFRIYNGHIYYIYIVSKIAWPFTNTVVGCIALLADVDYCCWPKGIIKNTHTKSMQLVCIYL